MQAIATKRIQRELSEIFNKENLDNSDPIEVSPVEDNILHLIASFTGPKDSPYESGIFKLNIEIPESYPFIPPKVRFITKIWHPNISSVTGAICLDILKDEWSGAMNIKVMILSIQAMISSPQPDDPQDAVVAKQYLTSEDLFKKTAQYWSYFYANGSNKNNALDEKLMTLVSMGIAQEDALQALSQCNWIIESAINKLYS